MQRKDLARHMPTCQSVRVTYANPEAVCNFERRKNEGGGVVRKNLI